MKWPNITNQLIAGSAATISALAIGFHSGWPAVSLPKLLVEDTDSPITPGEGSWIIGIFIVGGALGPLIAAALVDRYGRKPSLLVTVIPQLGACIIIAVSPNFWWLILARFMAGFTGGFVYTVVPMYLGEIADDRIRGVLGILFSIMLNLGILMTYSIGPWVSRWDLAGFGGALVLLFGLTFVWIPESPYFLLMKQERDRARKSLLWFRGNENAELEFERVQKNLDFDQKNSGTIKELVMVPGNRKALIIVFGLGLAQQLSGISAIHSYSSLIFAASGLPLDPSICVIIIGAVQLVSGAFTVFIIDSVGRRPLLLFSACGSALCLGGAALYFQLLANDVDVSAISWLPVTATTGYMICYSLGLAGIPHVIISEIFPCNAKALATMAVTEVLCLGGFVATVVYQTVADGYGIHVCFWVFTGITVFSVIFIYFKLPETKQKSLQSIQAELHNTTIKESLSTQQTRGDLKSRDTRYVRIYRRRSSVLLGRA